MSQKSVFIKQSATLPQQKQYSANIPQILDSFKNELKYKSNKFTLNFKKTSN